MSQAFGLIYVLDSSAMLAYLKGEPEGALVARLFKAPGAQFVAYSVNLCEVFSDFGSPSVEQNRRALQNFFR